MTFNKFSALTLAAALVVAPAAFAKDADSFVKKAVSSNMFEIESSKLALQKSSNEEVKAFAQKMIDDHTKASNELKAVLPKSTVADMELPTEMGVKHKLMMKDLESEKGNNFDEDYIEEQVRAHKEAVSLFNDYAKDGEDAVLKDFAAKTLPVLQMHDEHAKQLDEKLDD